MAGRWVAAASRKRSGRILVAKPGWADIGGQRCYFRSKRERMYAEQLETLRQTGLIASWKHEPQRFIFHKIERGTRSYLPDFRVTDAHGNVEYHEVKGWLDPKSVTQLRRMAKYYPEVTVKLIGASLPPKKPRKTKRS